ncbi:MAG TPA: SDR family NAD(P)-dependent oxidoreductase [Symbiobacteriaceae bacterium]
MTKDGGSSTNASQSQTSELMYYTGTWVASEPAAASAAAGNVLVFGGTPETWEMLRNRLAGGADGGRLIIVQPGSCFREVGEGVYEINPVEPGDYAACLKSLREKNMVPDRVLHLWALPTSADDTNAPSLEELGGPACTEAGWAEQFLRRGIHSVFHLIKAFAQAKIKSLVRFVTVYERELSLPNPFLEALAGYCRSISLVMPGLTFSTVEVQGESARPQAIARVALAEVTSPGSGAHAEVRYDERGQRLIRKTRELRLDQEGPVPFRQGGTYLITGGAGGLGQIFARYLSEQYRANLVLVGRSELDRARAEKIEEIRRLGGEVLYLRGDTTSLEDMDGVVQAVNQRFGPLHGVVHAAGSAGEKMILQKDQALFDATLSPKIQGTIALDVATRAEPLDFFVMFSSMTSFLGDFGQCDYAIGNRFLDTYAEVRERLREQGLRNGKTVGLNWPLWRDGGMHLSRDGEALYLRSSGIAYLEIEDGITALPAILSGAYTRVLVVRGDRTRVRRHLETIGETKEPAVADTKPAAAAPAPVPVQPVAGRAPVSSVQPPARPSNLPVETLVEQSLQRMAAAIIMLNPADLEVDANFGEYGFDSNGLKALAKQIGDTYSIELSPHIFFSHSTVRGLAGHMLEEFGDQVRSHYRQPGASTAPPQPAPVAAPSPRGRQLEPLVDKLRGHNRFGGGKPARERESVAIIGLAGIFPNAPDVDQFWRALESRRHLIREVPADRWDWRQYYGETSTEAAKHKSKWGGFIDDADKFDAPFFNISRREAELMDPQQRLLLQTAWKTFEDAGYKVSELSGRRIGVYMGFQFNDYQQMLYARLGVSRPQIATGNSSAVLANRISYLFNFRGPSEAIDTACSSSLITVHRAVQSVQSGESEMAIAGGVSLMLSPQTFLAVSLLGVMAPDGKCKTFDERANGYVRSEGVGTVLLKPLGKAIADGDHIYGVIRASAEGHGGRANSLTAPNAEAQAELLIQAYEQADFDPTTITYIEAHGTGTELGDPIEIDGLKRVFKELYQRKNKPWPPAERHCGIGSVKTNTGHLEPAAGIVGLTKVLLAIKHQRLPGTVHFTKLNPYINLDDSPLFIVEETKRWERLRADDGSELPLRTGVSSFGFGGSYAHLAIEEYLSPARQLEAAGPSVVVLSAKNKDRLRKYADNLAEYLKQHGDMYLPDVAYTLQTGREEMEERLAIVASDPAELAEVLSDYAAEREITGRGHTGHVKKGQDAVGLLVDGAEGQQFISAILRDGKLEKVAQLWVAGVAVDWNLLYPGQRPWKVTLPTYPFARESYWIPDDGEVAQVAPAVVAAAPVAPVAKPVVKKAPPPQSQVPVETLVEDEVRKIAAAILKIDAAQMDVQGNLGDYGFDSISLKEFADELGKAFSIEVLPTIFFAHGNVSSLAEYLLHEFGDTIKSRYAVSELARDAEAEEEEAGLAAEEPATTAEPVYATAPQGVQAPTGNEPVAIIGINGTFPGSASAEELWGHLENGQDLISEIPPDRWDWREYFGDYTTGKDKSNSKWGGFIQDVDKFDAQFFNISPLEAEMMDPQQRLFLQTVWKTIENAGYRPSELSGRQVGVYAGVQFSDYEDLLREVGETLPQMSTGVAHSVVSNRVSYLLNLKGPSESIDTACSSSLIAIHHAVRALRSGECELAVAGGVSLMLSVRSYLGAAKLGVLSPDGRCKTFDKGANGYVKGEGVGAVLLKPFSRAIEDGDHIYAVIRGTAQGHGGKAHSLTAPNPEAQARLLVRAYDDAGIDPTTVSYIEAHGTGTELGDPLETEGLKTAFRDLYEKHGKAWPPREPHCGVGSIKTNIGHLEPAAGIAGVTKLVMALQNGKLPATLHLREMNPYIDLKDSPFYIVRSTQPWHRLKDEQGNPIPRRAGVSSFGFGGAYAHVVLEEYEGSSGHTDSPDTEAPQLVLLSARTADSLRVYARELLDCLDDAPAGEEEALQWRYQENLRAMTAEILKVDPAQIDLTEPFGEYGLGPLEAAHLLERIKDHYQLDVAASAFSDVDSIETYARRLLGQQGSQPQQSARRCGSGRGFRLSDIAYTLQVGREPMEHRLAVVVFSKDELLEKLKAHLSGKSVADLFTGITEVLPGRSGQNVEKRRPRPAAAGSLSDTARAWVAGEEIDFTPLHTGFRRTRLPLPTYPFARTRHWVPKSATAHTQPETQQGSKLHPLLHVNVSTLREQKFILRLTGTEFFLRDHVVGGRMVLPGVAMLEMARAAGEISTEGPVRQIRNIVWTRPVAVTGDQAATGGSPVYVSLSPDEEKVSFEVFRDENGQRTRHAMGEILWADAAQPMAESRIPVSEIRSRCGRSTSGPECYAFFAGTGLQYGPGFQAIKFLYHSETEALARLELPAHLQAQSSQFVLHPTLVDGALQTVVGLLTGADPGSGRTFVPFSIGRLDLVGPLPGTCYAYARSTNAINADVARFDILVTDESGLTLLAIHDFSVRALPHSEATASAGKSPDLAELLLKLERGELDADEAEIALGGLYADD